MSRKGDCWDNAVAESFFATLRAESVDHELYVDTVQAGASIGDYIENFYNIERRHSHLGYLNPIEFELAFTNSEGCGIVTAVHEAGNFRPRAERQAYYRLAATVVHRVLAAICGAISGAGSRFCQSWWQKSVSICPCEMSMPWPAGNMCDPAGSRKE